MGNPYLGGQFIPIDCHTQTVNAPITDQGFFPDLGKVTLSSFGTVPVAWQTDATFLDENLLYGTMQPRHRAATIGTVVRKMVHLDLTLAGYHSAITVEAKALTFETSGNL